MTKGGEKNQGVSVPRDFLIQTHDPTEELSSAEQANQFIDAKLKMAVDGDEGAVLNRIIEECEIAERGEDLAVSSDESLVTMLRLVAQNRQKDSG